MPPVQKNRILMKYMIAISVFVNLIAIVFIFTPLKLETERQHNSFVSENVRVTNTLINLIEKNNLAITRAELISAIDSNNGIEKLFMGEKVDRLININSYYTLHFDVVKDTEVINKIWIESPEELPVD